MEFEKRKSATLSSLASSETDKSPKGTVDTPIIPLLKSLNSHPNYFTTSSCSGRISILAQPKPKPQTDSPTIKKKARGGSWLFISHEPANPDSVLPLLFPATSLDGLSDLVFRFEPLIIAVECRDIESAQFLVSLAISCGFRESGITSGGFKRVIVGIRCSIRMEVPLGDTENVLVSPEYVRFLVDVANEKMEANRMRTQGFFSGLIQHGFVGPAPAFSRNGELGCDDGDGDVQDEDLALAGANKDARSDEIIPEGFSFEIQDNPGERTILLERNYKDEIIKVEVDLPSNPDEEAEDDNDDQDKEESTVPVCIPMIVSISKGNDQCLEFGITAYADEITIDTLSIKNPDSSEDQLAYEGPDFGDLDENLQKAFHKYLEIRGIKPSTTNFLFDYMRNKDEKEYVQWLVNIKNFVEK